MKLMHSLFLPTKESPCACSCPARTPSPPPPALCLLGLNPPHACYLCPLSCVTSTAPDQRRGDRYRREVSPEGSHHPEKEIQRQSALNAPAPAHPPVFCSWCCRRRAVRGAKHAATVYQPRCKQGPRLFRLFGRAVGVSAVASLSIDNPTS